MSQPLSQEYAGQRLGLPEDGPGSVAGWGRRVAALFVDWIAAYFVATLVAAATDLGADAGRSLQLLVFVLEVTLFTTFTSASFGQLALRIVVARMDNGRVGFGRALLRTVLICLVIPPVVFNRDNRGLHDLAAGTVTLRR